MIINSLSVTHYYRDPHWYGALLLGIVFWVMYGVFVQPIQFDKIILPLRVYLTSVLLYPILEEIVFRGMLQESLSRKIGQTRCRKFCFMGLGPANIITSLAFSLLHLLSQEPLWAILIFFPSLIFGYFKDRYEQIFPSILLHSFYNLGFLSLIHVSVE